MSVSTISDSVGSMRCAIMWATGRLVKIEVPRSPCRIVPDPLAEAHQEGTVEAERGADALDVGGGRLIAGDDRRRVAGSDVEQTEYEQRHHQHYRNGGQNTPGGIGKHDLVVLLRSECHCEERSGPRA